MKKALALALAALMLLFVFGCSQPAAPDDEPGTTQAGSGETGGSVISSWCRRPTKASGSSAAL